jgi:hypothetical protein
LICPFCKDEIQQRVIFNHLRKKHEEEYYHSMDKKTVTNAIKNKAPIKLELAIPDERDESELKLVTLYGILGTDFKTNKSFISETRAITALKKDPKVLKEHLKQLESLEIYFKKKYTLRTSYLRASATIERSLRITWRYLTYVSELINHLKTKEIPHDEEYSRMLSLQEQFHDIVKMLPTDPKANLNYSTQSSKIFLLNRKAEGFFNHVTELVDRAYNFPVWIEKYQTYYHSENPSGNRMGSHENYVEHLTYPNYIHYYINDD